MSEILSSDLDVSEIFYSLQGEGISLGKPAVFLRLSKCNLCCGCGNLVTEGKATWTCDSQAVMKEYKTKSAEEVLEDIRALGDDVYTGLLLGEIHLIFTGGEPALYKEGIARLISLIDKDSVRLQIAKSIDPRAFRPPVYEVETNGTMFTSSAQFYEHFTFVNCSPKLANSGMPKDKRIVPFALIEISKHPQHFFKFVVSSEEDWHEIKRDFIEANYADPKRIFLMPAGATREEMCNNSAVVWNIAMREKVLATTRLHVVAFSDRKGI